MNEGIVPIHVEYDVIGYFHVEFIDLYAPETTPSVVTSDVIPNPPSLVLGGNLLKFEVCVLFLTSRWAQQNNFSEGI